MISHRCIVCNKVSTSDIQTEVGDLTKRHFKKDEYSTGFICGECEDWHEELMTDYFYQDDPYGWNIPEFNELESGFEDEKLY